MVYHYTYTGNKVMAAGSENTFYQLALKAKDPALLKKLFWLFFTKEERENLEKRCIIVETLLKKSLSQRALAKKAKVSIAQITRGSNALKIIDKQLMDFLNKNLK